MNRWELWRKSPDDCPRCTYPKRICPCFKRCETCAGEGVIYGHNVWRPCKTCGKRGMVLDE